jgi:trk system potassium uptake protein TrkA
MNIIIAGNGKVGMTLVRELSEEGHDLTVIDLKKELITATQDQYDVVGVEGNCASMPVLLTAGVQNADLVIAATNADEVNLLCCLTAHGLNPKIHTIARVRNPEYTEQTYAMRDQFGLSLTVNPEKQAATEIKRLMQYPGFLRRDTFAKGMTEIVELRVERGSKLCNVSLIDMYKIIKCQVLVCTVLRDGKAFAPSGKFVLKEGDRIFVTAPSKSLALLLRSLGVITRKVRSVILCGGDRISRYLAELLVKEGIGVKIIEKDAARCRVLGEQLEGVDIVWGDCSSKSFLLSQGLENCDALVALTGIDEMNMVISLYAKSQGVPQVITKLGRGENVEMADDLELGSVICPRELCSSNIVRYVRAMQNQTGAAVSVHAIADGRAEAVEFLVDEKTENCERPLKELKLKPGVLLASITRGKVTEIPNGNSSFRQGDTVVVVTTGKEVLHQLGDIFA